MKLLIVLIVAVATAAGGLFGISKYGEEEMRSAGNNAYRIEDLRSTTPEPVSYRGNDSEIPEHLRDGEEDSRPVVQEAYFPLHSPDAIRWGRNVNGLAMAARDGINGKAVADLGYCEYQMRPNGTFRYYGVSFGQKVVSEGRYELSGSRLKIAHLRVLESENGQEMLRYLPREMYGLQIDMTTGRRKFVSGIHTYLEDFYWDKVGYRDSSGQRFQASTQNQTPNGAPAMSADDEREHCAKKLLLLRRAAAEYSGDLRDVRALGPDGELTCTTTSEYYTFDIATKQIRCEFHKQ